MPAAPAMSSMVVRGEAFAGEGVLRRRQQLRHARSRAGSVMAGLVCSEDGAMRF